MSNNNHSKPQDDGELSTAATIEKEHGAIVTPFQGLYEAVDVRVGLDSRSTAEQLDDRLEHQLPVVRYTTKDSRSSHTFTKAGGDLEKSIFSETETKSEEPVYIEFETDDERNPKNFSLRRKWAITAIACFSTVLASSTTSSYGIGFQTMTRDLNCTPFEAVIGISVFFLGFAIVPLVTASFSEDFGRRPLYLISGVGFFLMYMMIALSNNIQTVIIARFLQGSFASTASTMVGGTIADIWSSKERGLPMAIFSLAALGGNGLGPFAAGWIEMNPRLGWRWIQWIQMIIAGGYLIVLPFVLEETRSSVLLTRIARKLRKTTGDHQYRAREEDERESLTTLIFISCTRPLYLLFTETIVLSFSIWAAFAWGVTFVLVESIADEFRTLHGFNISQVGSVFTAMTVGAVLGFISSFYQESLYQKYFPARGPEARLCSACAAGVLLPISMFIYAWCSYEKIPWITLAIGITLFVMATFIIYLAMFSYLADCYGPFASSAMAGQSLARNLAATSFPLFTQQMYQGLTYKWANTIFGCVALLMVPIPFILFFYGPTIRKRSKFSRAVMEIQQK